MFCYSLVSVNEVDIGRYWYSGETSVHPDMIFLFIRKINLTPGAVGSQIDAKVIIYGLDLESLSQCPSYTCSC